MLECEEIYFFSSKIIWSLPLDKYSCAVRNYSTNEWFEVGNIDTIKSLITECIDYYKKLVDKSNVIIDDIVAEFE